MRSWLVSHSRHQRDDLSAGYLHVLSPEFSPSWRVVSEHALCLGAVADVFILGHRLVGVGGRHLVPGQFRKGGLGVSDRRWHGEAMATVFDIKHSIEHGIADLLPASPLQPSR